MAADHSANNEKEIAKFLKRIHKEIKQKAQGRTVDIGEGFNLYVDGVRVDCKDLWRMAQAEQEKADSLIETFIKKILSDRHFSNDSISWDDVHKRIMPRIRAESIFEQLDRASVAHVPFVNNTVIVFVLDFPDLYVTITMGQVALWGKTLDDIHKAALVNLDAKSHQDNLALLEVEIKEGGTAVLINNNDGYDSSRLLLPNLFNRLSGIIPGNFLVFCPTRDTFLAISEGESALTERVKTKADLYLKDRPYPITPDPFLVVQDGIAGTISEGPGDF